jgi:hypothetical protein
MHVFVELEAVKRAVVTKRGVSEWGVVSQARIDRFSRAEAWLKPGASWSCAIWDLQNGAAL